MSWIPDKYQGLRDLVRRGHHERDVDEEFEAHLAMRTEELVRSGLAPAAARAEALRRFGDLPMYRSQTDRIDNAARNRAHAFSLRDTAGRELRGVARRLVRQPSFTAATTLALGLGIAVTTVVFAILNAVVLRALPYPEAGRLVRLTHPVPGVGPQQAWGLSVASYFHMASRTRTLDALGVAYPSLTALFAQDRAERVPVVFTSASMFRVLGVRPALGRLFSEQETRPGSTPVTLIGHALWQRRFGSDRTIVGRTIELESRQVEVIGVLPAEFEFPGRPIDLWRPLELDSTGLRERAVNSHYLLGLGVTRPGVPLERVQEELASFIATFPELYPTAYTTSFLDKTGFGARVVTLAEDLAGDSARVLWTLLAAMLVVLLVAVANVSNLLVARFESRARDVAVRLALGAQRSHLAFHFLVEGAALAFLAAVCGLLLAALSLPLVVRAAPYGIPRLAAARIDWSVVGWLSLAVLVLAVALGTVPLWRLRRMFEALREGGRGSSGSPGRTRARSSLVVAQVALSLVLLASAGLLMRTGFRLGEVPLGFVPEHAMTFDVTLPFAGYRGYDRVADFHRQLADRLLAIPGVEAVGATQTLPLSDAEGCSVVFLEGRPVPPGEQPPCVTTMQVTPGAFEALGMRVRGRSRTWADETGLSDGVVVSAALAHRLWPGQDALGMGIKSNGDGGTFYHVIGVAEDTRLKGLEQPPLEAVYFPMRPIPGAPLWDWPRFMNVVVRVRGDQGPALASLLTSAVADLDPHIPVANMRPLEDQVEKAMARTNFILVLLAGASAMAVLIASVGLFGVVSYGVTQRQRELGVRIALGASGAGVRAMVVRESLALAGIGVGVGLLGATMTTRVLRSLLFGISPLDPATLFASALTLVLVAVFASVGPARRAANADPIQVLRAE